MIATELRRAVADHVGRYDPRPSVREQVKSRLAFKGKMDTLLAGKSSRHIHLEQPIFSAIAWEHPTDVRIAKTPQGYKLDVITNYTTKNNYSYGNQIEIKDGELEMHEVGNRLVKDEGLGFIISDYRHRASFYSKESGWKYANVLADRVVMATSDDAEVKRRYNEMRKEEQRRFEESLARSLADDSM